MTGKHPIILLDDLVANKKTANISSLIYCEEHQGEVVKAYCVDHSKPLCTLCATLLHRKCEDVVTIETAVSGIKKSEKATKLSTELKETSKQLSDLIQNRKDLRTDYQKEAEFILTKVSTIKDNIVKHLNIIEGQIKDEINKSKKEVGLKLFEKSAELESLKSTVDNWIAIYDTCLHHGSELQCLLEMNRINENKEKFGEAVTKCISEMKNVSMRLEANDAADLFSKGVAVIGVVRVNETDASCPKLLLGKTINFQTGNINVIKVINLTGNNVYLSGLFMRDEFIFSHYQLLKVLKYGHNGDRLAELKLPQSPCDIDEINNTLAAVSTDSSNIYTINTDDMTINRVLSNTFPSHGFCHINGEFILAHNNTLTWINSSTGVKTGQANTNGNTYYIYARERKNYICTDGTNTVSKIVNDIKVFAYTNDKLVSSRGVDVDTDGNVYICSFSSGNIHQLTKDGTLVRIISADSVGIKQPWVIRFKKNSNRFLVTCYNTGKVAVCEIV